LVLDEPKEKDKVYDYEQVKMVIDNDLLTQVGSVNVDYKDSAWRSGFSIKAGKELGGGGSSCGSKCC
jgi:Fe-S cluster assembly iron-binding protein IscA